MKKVLLFFLCSMLFFVHCCQKVQNKLQNVIKAERKNAAVNYLLYKTMNSWLMLGQKGKTIIEYFEKNGYYNIAIYGMGNMGERLYDTLNGTDVHVKYGIDKNAENIFTTLQLYKPEKKMEEVDAIIVTAIYYFDDIKKDLCTKVSCPIISLEKIIEETLQG